MFTEEEIDVFEKENNLKLPPDFRLYLCEEFGKKVKEKISLQKIYGTCKIPEGADEYNDDDDYILAGMFILETACADTVGIIIKGTNIGTVWFVGDYGRIKIYNSFTDYQNKNHYR